MKNKSEANSTEEKSLHVRRGTEVELESVDLGKRRFKVEEAEALLSNPLNRKAWSLAEDSAFEFENGKITQRGGSSPAQETQE